MHARLVTGALRFSAMIGVLCLAGLQRPSPATGAEMAPTLRFSAIPDQDETRLREKFEPVARYLADALGVPVEYVHATRYSDSVELFKNGDIQLAWFGGLTGVQARHAVPGARACLDLCMFAESSRFEQELVATGDGGKLACTVPGDELVVGTRKRKDHRAQPIPLDPRVQHVGFHHGASYLEHLDFMAAIANGQRAKVSADDGLRSVAIGVAAHRSIECGAPVSLEELGGL